MDPDMNIITRLGMVITAFAIVFVLINLVAWGVNGEEMHGYYGTLIAYGTGGVLVGLGMAFASMITEL